MYVTYTRLITCFRLLQWLVTCKDFRLPEDGSNWVAETCRSNLNNNKLINEKLICAFRWSVLPSNLREFILTQEDDVTVKLTFLALTNYLCFLTFNCLCMLHSTEA